MPGYPRCPSRHHERGAVQIGAAWIIIRLFRQAEILHDEPGRESIELTAGDFVNL